MPCLLFSSLLPCLQTPQWSINDWQFWEPQSTRNTNPPSMLWMAVLGHCNDITVSPENPTQWRQRGRYNKVILRLVAPRTPPVRDAAVPAMPLLMLTVVLHCLALMVTGFSGSVTSSSAIQFNRPLSRHIPRKFTGNLIASNVLLAIFIPSTTKRERP